MAEQGAASETEGPLTFGELLRRYRMAAGLSQDELAELAGLSAHGISDLERGARQRPYPDTVQRLADSLRLEPAQRAALVGAARRSHRAGATAASQTRGAELPQPLSSFVGREGELADVRRLLGQVRLLTLTGTGGIGKTRLALELAGELLDGFRDGVWLVELAALNDPALVARAVAATLGVREKARQSLVETLAESLADRYLLLVLDNCEHLIETCADLTHDLLSRCPRLRILATSREALSVAGEAAWQLPPLSVPGEPGGLEEADQVAQSAAGRLFVERARAAVPSFEVNERNAGAIAEICRRLDGVPLAVELAAARVPVLGVEQIASRLDDRFRVLTGGSRTAPRRHQTLRAAVDWSYDQLSAAEQRLFNQLSVFAAGWTLEAAEAVGSVDSSEGTSSGFSSSLSAGAPGEHTRPASVGGGEPFDLLDLLAQLVAKSLIVADPRPDGQVRYRQLQTLRIYAKEQLERSGQLAAVQRRHSEYFLGLAERAEAELRGPQMSTWLDRLEADHDNLRFALVLYLQEGNIERAQRLGGALWLFWQQRGYLEEGWNWVTRILALPGADARTPARAKLLLGAGLIAHSRADEHVSIALCEEALELGHALGDHAQATWSLVHLGILARFRYDFPRARALFAEGLALARAAGIRSAEAEVLLNLGRLEYLEGDLNAAVTALERALPQLEGFWQNVWRVVGSVVAVRVFDPGGRQPAAGSERSQMRRGAIGQGLLSRRHHFRLSNA